MSAYTRNKVVSHSSQMRLHNRRVMVGLRNNGNIAVKYKTVRPCDNDGKYIKTTEISLTPEAAAATVILLIELLNKIEPRVIQ